MTAYVNEYGRNLDVITPERVTMYEKLLKGEPIFTGTNTRAKLEKTKGYAAGLHKVTVFRATEATQCRFLKRPANVGAAAASDDDDGSYVKFECDCEDMFRSGGGICGCALAVAASKFRSGYPHIDLDLLLQSTAATRRPAGRPRTADTGNCYGDSASSSSASSSGYQPRSSAHYYETQLNERGAMYYHKWRVLKEFDVNNHVGTVVSYRDDFCEEPRPYNSETPKRRLWTCRYDDFEVGDDTEEYEAKELAPLLSAAHKAGINGPASHDQPNKQLLTAPANSLGGARRKFHNYAEKDEPLKTNRRFAEAKLIKKYSSIRFYDADAGDGDGEFYRIRSDHFTWDERKGWAASCDKMLSEDPASDPTGDLDVTHDCEPVDYCINAELYGMITAARQAPGVVLVEEEEDDDDDDSN